MENNMKDMEMEELRQQMMTLKQQLEEQVQINDELVMKRLKRNILDLKSIWLIMTIAGAIGGAYIIPKLLHIGLSLACVLAVIVCLIGEICCEFYITHHVRENDLKDSFSETLKKIRKIKELDRKITIVDYIIGIGLLVWAIFDILSGQVFQDLSTRYRATVIILICISILLGLLMSIKLYKYQQQKMNDMIDMLDKDN